MFLLSYGTEWSKSWIPTHLQLVRQRSVNYGLADTFPQTLSQSNPQVGTASVLTLRGPLLFYLKSHGPPASTTTLLFSMVLYIIIN